MGYKFIGKSGLSRLERYLRTILVDKTWSWAAEESGKIKPVKIKTMFWYFAVITLLIVACQRVIKPKETETIINLSNSEFHTKVPSGLSLDIYELEEPPRIEPMVFLPASATSQEQILAVHEKDRNEWYSDVSYFEVMDDGMKVQYKEGDLIAQMKGSVIEVFFNDELIFAADTGDMSPISPLRGLWSYDENWVLEYATVTVTQNDAENTVYSEGVGHLVRNEVLLNEAYGYGEAFGFQLLDGKPFYFFERNGRIGLSFAGEEMALGFDKILHYECCSAGVLNPNQAQRMVSFFAQKDHTWYYVEIGVYE